MSWATASNPTAPNKTGMRWIRRNYKNKRLKPSNESRRRRRQSIECRRSRCVARTGRGHRALSGEGNKTVYLNICGGSKPTLEGKTRRECCLGFSRFPRKVTRLARSRRPCDRPLVIFPNKSISRKSLLGSKHKKTRRNIPRKTERRFSRCL